MKRIFALALSLGVTAAALAQTTVGVSIGINQPGVYGRINIGALPPPALVLPQPVIIVPPQVVIERRPIYLYVPEAHQSDWRRYCGRYGACGQPVYFVQEAWVREQYEAQHPGWNNGKHRGHDKHDEHDEHDERHHDNGRGNDHKK